MTRRSTSRRHSSANTSARSFTPRSNTDWFSTGMPASTSRPRPRPRRRRSRPDGSREPPRWVKAESLAASEISSSVTRWGITIGSRLWIRSRRRCGISANSVGQLGQLGVGQHQRVAAAEDYLVESRGRRQFLAPRAPNNPRRPRNLRRESAAGNRSGNGRHTPQLLPSRFGPGYFRSRPGPQQAPASPSGSAL